MKKIINWKLFFLLLTASLIVTLLVLPFTIALSPALAKVFTPTILIAQIAQSLVEFSIAIFFGLLLIKRVGFTLPVLEDVFKGGKQGDYVKSILWLSIGMGVLGAILVIL